MDAAAPTHSTTALLDQLVRERTRELTTLLDVSRVVASTLELEPLLGVICEQLKLVVASHGAAISLLDDGDLVLVASTVSPDEVGRRVPLLPTSPINAVIKERRALTLPDVQGDNPLALAYRKIVSVRRYTALAHVRTLLWVPLVSKERVIGVLGASHPEPDYFTPHHEELAIAIANQAAVAIENARLHEQTLRHAAVEERQRLARELHDSVSQALYGIGLGRKQR